MKTQNPFSGDADREYIWEMLVARDIRAFINCDWAMVKDDFIVGNFMGIDGGRSSNPGDWRFKFPTVETYKVEWLRQAQSFKENKWLEDPGEALFRLTKLKDIQISDNCATVHKIFDGKINGSDGQDIPFCWRTVYYCRKMNGIWKIAGFNGYLPLYSKTGNEVHPGKHIPENTDQFKTTGPYSPILVVDSKRVAVISGQAAITGDGKIEGDTIEEQTVYTLNKCRHLLNTAGCLMTDVFKVNVYLNDIGDWYRFNEVYKKYFDDFPPVRTTVQAGLLPGLLVEIDLWAVKQ